MGSAAREQLGLRRDTAARDRQVAALLSALAEAPDFAAALSFLLAQLAEIGEARRAYALVPDDDGGLRPAAQVGFTADDPRPSRLSIANVDHPLVISALALLPIMGRDSDARHAMAFVPWLALPLPRPHYRGAPKPLAEAQAHDRLAGSSSAQIAPLSSRRPTSTPGGVVVVEALPGGELLDALAEIAALAGPIVMRFRELDDAESDNERLRQQRDRLTLMVDSLPDPVVITNASNDIISSNRQADHLLNARESDSPGRRRAIELNNLLFTSYLAKAMMGGSVGGARELNLVDPDEGSDLLFEVLTHPLGARVGPEDAVLSVLRDVTDLRRASHELERQVQRVRQGEIKARGERDRLNLILENVADPILVTDEKSNIILMNEQAERLFQVTNASGMPNPRQLHAVRGNDTKFTSFISEFALMNQSARRERMVLTQPLSGLGLPVEVVSGKITNERGEPIAIVSVLHDLTREAENERLYEALKRLNSELEERIRAATADLAEQNARLQWQSQELERANRLKSEFLASMSHELRTPINALIGYAALLLDGVLGEITLTQRDALTRARAAAEHLLALINDILDLAKIEAGKMPLHIQEVSLAAVTREVAQQMEPLVHKKGLRFNTEVASECPVILSDRTKVKQILLNLVSNAVKFTNEGSVLVAVECAAEGGVRIKVADTGIGIRREDLDAIWEDFRQVDQSRTREHGGTGLGLSITRKLLNRLGGRATVESEYAKGTTFTIWLPARIETGG
ncbi:MAG: ATP-binding protein [Gemmatimonadota bacterium]|nr:ATP-binding protein [Gemmatimonadota bacterium]